MSATKKILELEEINKLREETIKNSQKLIDSTNETIKLLKKQNELR